MQLNQSPIKQTTWATHSVTPTTKRQISDEIKNVWSFFHLPSLHIHGVPFRHEYFLLVCFNFSFRTEIKHLADRTYTKHMPPYAAAITRNTARIYRADTWNIRHERRPITLNTFALSTKSTPPAARAKVQTPPEIRDFNSSLKHPDCPWGPPSLLLNRLKPNDLKKRSTAQLTSRRCILYIYSTNIRTEYFKHAA